MQHGDGLEDAELGTRGALSGVRGGFGLRLGGCNVGRGGGMDWVALWIVFTRR